MPEWTDKQRAAIESRGWNLLVSAAAGSGKTAVMVERVRQLVIGDRVPLDRILVVTFTNAAAGSMRARIVEALESALGVSGGSDAFLRGQLSRVEDAWISTLHAFCARLLRQYYPAAGIDPGFRVMEEDEASILRMGAMEDALAAAFEAMPPGFAELADAWGGRDGTALSELAERLHRFAMSRVEGLAWLDKALGDYDPGADLRRSAWVAELLREAEETISAAAAILREALRVCRSQGGPSSYGKALEADAAGVAGLGLAARGGYDALVPALLSFRFGPIGRRGKNDDPGAAEAVQALRGRVKDLIGDLAASPLALPLEPQAAALGRMRPVLSALCGLVRDFAERYAAGKAARGGLDFDDLEQCALRVVADGESIRDLRGRFDAVFVDEYQDTNPVQERIVTTVSREGCLFCVGDVKQSIYRFRQAEPALFESRYERSGSDAPGRDRRIDMNRNFRSDPGIIDGVNYVFSRIMTPRLGGVRYDANAALLSGVPRAPGDGPAFELAILTDGTCGEDAPDGPDGWAGDDLSVRAVWEREAQWAASRILEMAGKPIRDARGGGPRPARWRDFVILMRTVTGRAHEVASVLESRGIPVFADASAGFFDRTEIAWLLSALELTDNRWRDISMIAALRSPMAGLTLDELLEIRTSGGGLPGFAESVFRYAREGSGPSADKVRSFLAMLERWRMASRHLRADELMERVLEDTGLFDIVGAMPGGDLRQGNLRVLMDRARKLSETPARGLFGFLRHISRLRERSIDPGEARPLSERDDVVRVMSVHKSKGLEFPIVFVLGLGHRFNMDDTRAPLLLHGDLGMGTLDYDMPGKLRRDTLPHEALARRLRREALCEGVRVLYVAMTRAMERLVLVGSVGTLERKLGRWSLPLLPALLAQQGTPLDWVAAAALRHPDGGALRRLSPSPPEIENGAPGSWAIAVVSPERTEAAPPVSAGLDPDSRIRAALRLPPDPEAAAAFSWAYPFEAAVRLPAKTTATALVRHAGTDEPGFGTQILPSRAAGEAAADAALRGTLTHTALRLVSGDSQEEIARGLEALERSGVLPAGGAALVSPGDILAFRRSHAGRRAAAAKNTLREAPFVVKVPACELYPAEYPGVAEPVLVQGVLDLAFEEEDGWVLVDYKTNRVDERRTPDMLLELYRPQLSVYMRALRELTGRPVKAAGLYLTSLRQMAWLPGLELDD